ncbi:hypothetical protein GCM10020258_37720 [Sphingomonas yabuuchiae]
MAWLLRGQAAVERSGTRRSIDIAALVLLAAALVALQIGLKDAPTRGWGDARVLGLLAVFVACGGGFVVRTWRAAVPLVELRCFADRNFAIGCLFSFVLGFGLFGSTYLMPFFLGLVREHGALRIGEIMLVTGIAQLVSAPIAVWAERRVDPRWLTAFGFGLFAIGLLMSMSQTAQTDFHAMILPQVVRGAAIMFCLLPPTRMALGRLPRTLVADGSGLFNLMRNLGGAVGLALVDTMIFSRAATEGAISPAAFRRVTSTRRCASASPRTPFWNSAASRSTISPSRWCGRWWKRPRSSPPSTRPGRCAGC